MACYSKLVIPCYLASCCKTLSSNTYVLRIHTLICGHDTRKQQSHLPYRTEMLIFFHFQQWSLSLTLSTASQLLLAFGLTCPFFQLSLQVSSGVDPEGARGAIAPPIKIYQGESIFSPPQSFSLFFIFQCTI